MRSDRNPSTPARNELRSLDDWEMRSDRNLTTQGTLTKESLDDWEMRSASGYPLINTSYARYPL